MTHCGTPQGMKAHQNRNEPPCKWCKKAVENPAPVSGERSTQRSKPAGSKRPVMIGPHRKPGRPRKPREEKAPRLRTDGKPWGSPVECGTLPGYEKHKRDKTPVCDKCRKEMNRLRNENRKKHKAAQRGPDWIPKRARKLTADQVRDIVKRIEAGERQHVLAKEYGVKNNTIGSILTGANWSAVTGIKKRTRQEQAA